MKLLEILTCVTRNNFNKGENVNAHVANHRETQITSEHEYHNLEQVKGSDSFANYNCERTTELAAENNSEFKSVHSISKPKIQQISNIRKYCCK